MANIIEIAIFLSFIIGTVLLIGIFFKAKAPTKRASSLKKAGLVLLLFALLSCIAGIIAYFYYVPEVSGVYAYRRDSLYAFYSAIALLICGSILMVKLRTIKSVV